MKTTFNSDADGRDTAGEPAVQESSGTADIQSQLARQGTTDHWLAACGRSAAGFPTLPKRGSSVAHEHVRAIQDIEGI